MSQRTAFTICAVLLTSVPALPATCRSVAGHVNETVASAVRSAAIKGSMITLGGRMNGKAMPRRSLPCQKLAKGVLCGGAFGPVNVTVTTNGNRMIESVTSASTGEEQAGFAYQCDGPMRMR